PLRADSTDASAWTMLVFFCSAIFTASSAVRGGLDAVAGPARLRRIRSATGRIGGGSPWGPARRGKTRGQERVRTERVRGFERASRAGTEQCRDRGRKRHEREVQRH